MTFIPPRQMTARTGAATNAILQSAKKAKLKDIDDLKIISAASFTVLTLTSMGLWGPAKLIESRLADVFPPILPLRLLSYATKVITDSLDPKAAERLLRNYFTEEERKEYSVRLIRLNLVAVEQAIGGLVDKPAIKSAMQELEKIAETGSESDAARARAIMTTLPAL